MAEHRSAMVDAAGRVGSVVMRDDTLPWEEPVGVITVDIPLDSPVGPGWSYDGGTFTPPPEPEEPPADA